MGDQGGVWPPTSPSMNWMRIGIRIRREMQVLIIATGRSIVDLLFFLEPFVEIFSVWVFPLLPSGFLGSRGECFILVWEKYSVRILLMFPL